jgi:hypothetical protein
MTLASLILEDTMLARVLSFKISNNDCVNSIYLLDAGSAGIKYIKIVFSVILAVAATSPGSALVVSVACPGPGRAKPCR